MLHEHIRQGKGQRQRNDRPSGNFVANGQGKSQLRLFALAPCAPASYLSLARVIFTPQTGRYGLSQTNHADHANWQFSHCSAIIEPCATRATEMAAGGNLVNTEPLESIALNALSRSSHYKGGEFYDDLVHHRHFLRGSSERLRAAKGYGLTRYQALNQVLACL